MADELQNVTDGSAGLAGLDRLEADVSGTEILVGRFIAAVRLLQPEVEHLEADVEDVTGDFSRVIEKTLKTKSDLGKLSQNAEGTALKAEDLVSGAEALLAPIRVLDIIRNHTADPVDAHRATIHRTADSLAAADDLLSDARDAVGGTRGQHLKGLRHLQHLQTRLARERSSLLLRTETTRGRLKDIADVFTRLEKTKKGFEIHAAQLDGAQKEIFKKRNNILQTTSKMKTVADAEERQEELSGAAAECQQMLHNATGSIGPLGLLGKRADSRITNAVEKAAAAANRSREAAREALQGAEEGGLAHRAAGLKDNSTDLLSEAHETQRELEVLSRAENASEDHVSGKGETLRSDISTVVADLEKTGGDDTGVLIEAAKAAAAASDATASHVAERLRNISRDVERKASAAAAGSVDEALLVDTERTLKNLSVALATVRGKITRVEALGRKAPPGGNMTESIRRIKDVIAETRTFVKRMSLATTFDGNGHVELRPPRNLEDVKAFTAVDLLLNRHRDAAVEGDSGRTRRRNKRRDGGSFASGDFIGMAIRSNVLVCVYKLGGVAHEVETSHVRTTSNPNSSDFDRVVFRRVYQDAEVNVTRNFTSPTPVGLAPKRNLPNTTSGALELDPDSPPVELHYPNYRGAMKLSSVNDDPVSLFDFRRAVGMEAEQPTVKVPRAEASGYYEGTGYRMALTKEPTQRKRRLFRFHTNSRETDALLFYIGNEDSFFCLFVASGFLVLRGRQAGRELRVQSDERVSLFDKHFAIAIADQVIVHYGPRRISTGHDPATYTSFYIGGLPAQLRERHDIAAPPLRGCVDRLTADAEVVEFERTIGVGDGCPVSRLGVRSAMLSSPLSVDAGSEQPIRVSLGFRSSDRHGALLRSSSQGSTSALLSLADGHVVFNSDNYTLRSEKRYSDGRWHHVSAVQGPTGLELSVDNVKVTPGPSPHIGPLDQNVQRGKFKVCIANLYARRFGNIVKEPTTVLTPMICVLFLRPHFSLDIKTRSSRGLILHVAGRGAVPLLALYVANGKIRMSLGQNRVIQHQQRSNDGNWHRVIDRLLSPALQVTVEVSVEKSSFHLLVDGIRVTDGRLARGEGSSLQLLGPVYLGADPESKTTKGRGGVPVGSVAGCVRSFRMNEAVVEGPAASYNTAPCFDGTGTHFSGGHVVLEDFFPVGAQFVLAFELRPRRLAGLLFHARGHGVDLRVFLSEAEVGVKVEDGDVTVSVSVTPPTSLCDGDFHLVTVSKRRDAIELAVDSESQQRAAPFTPGSTALSDLYVGGSSERRRAPGPSAPFEGCLRNVRLDGSPVALDTSSRVVDPVDLHGCRAD
ncbi:Laminin subunit alpha-3 [Liparis tanakae]|uniref:Laminin subunit alpha-3 n=1 Tax=Liparis tanakae TaxID=230148 RepID=A0A4Z2FN13_9TELE|nr:Laminin subunit alpha-3 [Liparis tanakae]